MLRTICTVLAILRQTTDDAARLFHVRTCTDYWRRCWILVTRCLLALHGYLWRLEKVGAVSLYINSAETEIHRRLSRHPSPFSAFSTQRKMTFFRVSSQIFYILESCMHNDNRESTEQGQMMCDRCTEVFALSNPYLSITHALLRYLDLTERIISCLVCDLRRDKRLSNGGWARMQTKIVGGRRFKGRSGR